MRKSFQFILFLVLINAVNAFMTSFSASSVEKITGGHEKPISSQNEDADSSSQLPGEETEDEDDQNKFHEKPPIVIIDLTSESLPRLQLLFKEHHHEVITPPPQS